MVAVSKKTRIDYVADFETTTDPEDCRVWGWGLVAVETPHYDNVEIGFNIESFFERIQQHNANVYFHNLKFDGTFILDWLLRHEYAHTESRFKTQPGEFKTLISSQGKFYSITVVWKNGKTTEFRDSAKKFPNFTVAKLAKAYELADVKGDIDYRKPRPLGYIMDDEEEDYLRRDVIIVAQALKVQFDEGLTKLTAASDSMAEFKHLYGAKKFKRVFPVLPTEMDREIRQSYRGGFTYADDRHTKHITRGGIVLDVNSLYPHIMFTSLLPYDEPRFHRGRVELTQLRPLSIFSVTFTARIKPEHIPCIQIKGHSFFVNTEYLKTVDEPTTLWVTSVDWELWNEHYDIEVQSYNGGWSFKGAQGFFDDYINKWMAVKRVAEGGRRQIAKGHLNNLYGKFGANPNVTGKIPYIDEHNKLKMRLGEDEERPPVYSAMASFVTAYARALTIRAAQANYDTFAYADTDSLHLLRDSAPDTILVHPDELGAWKLEYAFDAAFYNRAKFYLERKLDGTFHVAIAGLSDKVTQYLTFDDIWDGNELTSEWVRERSGNPLADGALKPRNVPGGVVLFDAPFTVTV